jgi:release factor glutamine methyltransferase
MNVKQALGRARRLYDAPLECEIILRHAMGIDRVQMYLNLNLELTPEQEETFWGLLGRRLNGEPVAYITGRCEFYGLDFYVDKRVLVPRPETELLVDEAIGIAQQHPVNSLAEGGTGSGAIAICLALNIPQANIYATDASAAALEVALINCQTHGLEQRIQLLHGDMLAPLPEAVDLIVANLPYVREAELPLTTEPRLALDGGADGLDAIRRLCQGLDRKLKPRGHLVLEIGQGQAAEVSGLLRGLFPRARVEVSPDLAGIERVVSLLA